MNGLIFLSSLHRPNQCQYPHNIKQKQREN
uniref:Uncharacterized protein n=1 Tax=Anguilla anguilla TaxID=7936 RepID=A0A0E9T2L9_ANGAN